MRPAPCLRGRDAFFCARGEPAVFRYLKNRGKIARAGTESRRPGHFAFRDGDRPQVRKMKTAEAELRELRRTVARQNQAIMRELHIIRRVVEGRSNDTPVWYDLAEPKMRQVERVLAHMKANPKSSVVNSCKVTYAPLKGGFGLAGLRSYCYRVKLDFYR